MSGPVWHLHATLLPGGSEPRDLWIAEGRITFVPQPGAEELAAPGGFASAGLVDAHTHLHFVAQEGARRRGPGLVAENRRRYLDAGVLLLRDLGATSDDVLHLPDDDGLPAVQAAGMCLLVEDRFPFQITAAHELAAAAGGQARGGAAWVKIFVDWPGWPGTQEEPPWGDDPLTYPTGTLRDAVEAAHAGGARVAAHTFGRDGARAALDAGVDSLEHGWGLDEAMVDEMAARGVGWTPMLGIAAPMVEGAKKTGNTRQLDWMAATMDKLRTLLPYAVRKGVPVLAGTDWFPAVTVGDEAEALHRIGLSRGEALAAASTVARRFLRAPSLDEGAPADVVVFRGDPRQDLRVLDRPEVVVRRGLRVPRAAAAAAR